MIIIGVESHWRAANFCKARTAFVNVIEADPLLVAVDDETLCRGLWSRRTGNSKDCDKYTRR